MSSETLLRRDPASSAGGFGFFVALCFCVNYVLGTGFLALPWAFNSAGIVFSCIVLALTGVLCDMAKDLMLEALSITELLERTRCAGRPMGGIDLSYATMDVADDEEDEPEEGRMREPLVSPGGPSAAEAAEAQAAARRGELALGDSRYEVTELCEVLLGPRGRDLYTGVVCVYMYGSMWAYASVFGSALAAHVPLPFLPGGEHASYLLYLGTFGLVTVPLTCMEMKDQVSLQVLLALLRCVLVAAIVGSTAAAVADGGGGAFDGVDGAAGAPLWRPSQVYRLAPIALYSNIFHHSIPGLSASVRDKASLSRLFAAVFATVNAAYMLIGVTVALYFGGAVRSSANLNWTAYAAGPAAWREALSFFVVIFPALDVLSAFPLNGITLGNNMSAAFYGDAAAFRLRSDRFAKTRWRLLAAVPPLLGAAAVRDLGVITEFAGTSGFLIAFFFPAVLYLAARRRYELEAATGVSASKASLAALAALAAADVEAEAAAGGRAADVPFDDRGILPSLAFGARCAPAERVTIYGNCLSSPAAAFALAAAGAVGMVAVLISISIQEIGAS